MTTSKGQPALMTSAEVAALLGVSTRTVERLTTNGKLHRSASSKPRQPGQRGVGTQVYFDRAEVLAYQRTARPSEQRDAYGRWVAEGNES